MRTSVWARQLFSNLKTRWSPLGIRLNLGEAFLKDSGDADSGDKPLKEQRSLKESSLPPTLASSFPSKELQQKGTSVPSTGSQLFG